MSVDLVLLRGGRSRVEAPVQLQFWSQEPSLDARLRVQNAALLLLLDALPRVEAAMASAVASDVRPVAPRPLLSLVPDLDPS
jgi:hypothetical protein